MLIVDFGVCQPLTTPLGFNNYLARSNVIVGCVASGKCDCGVQLVANARGVSNSWCSCAFCFVKIVEKTPKEGFKFSKGSPFIKKILSLLLFWRTCK